jgi:hypothetical protein
MLTDGASWPAVTRGGEQVGRAGPGGHADVGEAVPACDVGQALAAREDAAPSTRVRNSSGTCAINVSSASPLLRAMAGLPRVARKAFQARVEGGTGMRA